MRGLLLVGPPPSIFRKTGPEISQKRETKADFRGNGGGVSSSFLKPQNGGRGSSCFGLFKLTATNGANGRRVSNGFEKAAKRQERGSKISIVQRAGGLEPPP